MAVGGVRTHRLISHRRGGLLPFPLRILLTPPPPPAAWWPEPGEGSPSITAADDEMGGCSILRSLGVINGKIFHNGNLLRIPTIISEANITRKKKFLNLANGVPRF